MRALPNCTTGLTPNLMMLGQEVRRPLDLVFETENTSTKQKQPHEFALELKKRLSEVHALAREAIGGLQLYQKRYFDYTKNQTSFQEGDVVYKLNKASKSGQSSKLKPIWHGPFLVSEILSPILIRIQDKKGTYVVHHDLLKTCETGNYHFGLDKNDNSCCV